MAESEFETADGISVHYRDHQPRSTAGIPVLCLHGLTRNERDFEELGPRIVELGRRVIIATQRGRGLSGWDPDAERYNPSVYVADMLGLLDRLAIEKAVFVGTSMGGLMTMIAAAMAPERVGAAVLNDIGPEIDPAGLERIRSYAGGSRTARSWLDAASLCRDINGVSFPAEAGEAFWIAFAKRIFREVAPGEIVLDYDPAIARTVSGPQVDLWPLFDVLKPVPTLLIRGDISDVLMRSTVAAMRARKPDLAFAAVPEVGHAPFMTEPAAWAALSDFLRTSAP
ncbi:alpha/beta fold hydrolase [Phenylobacterium immobile]|uniref:alpha/beta fold hydrolase n=1 Tax=Phenylobacterium immobile TaxID=21 RepID=UPI000AC01816|nr:alpha/beta hydrolase [Phenylobacterium immobile]